MLAQDHFKSELSLFTAQRDLHLQSWTCYIICILCWVQQPSLHNIELGVYNVQDLCAMEISIICSWHSNSHWRGEWANLKVPSLLVSENDVTAGNTTLWWLCLMLDSGQHHDYAASLHWLCSQWWPGLDKLDADVHSTLFSRATQKSSRECTFQYWVKYKNY